ncbi:hypothetical protein FH972_012521 [Carpinus fangiana]|uniref:CS domain-containing protein n=1 Tax=Carpinus fangiana TaxID=176857 RepID=A0A5N6R498_9ROSI|nr:hypothetical protein FH972_012521 [Carpinus fangiana]
MASTNLCFLSQSTTKILNFSLPKLTPPIPKPNFLSVTSFPSSFPRFLWSKVATFKSSNRLSCRSASTIPVSTKDYEFSDGSSEVELRLQLNVDVQNSRDIFVDSNDTSLTIRVQRNGYLITLIETNNLFGKIKPAETIWYIDDDQLVINLKKQDPDLKWPDIVESWESLTMASTQLLQGTSIYIVGDSTEINQKVAGELAVGLGYTPLSTKELLETYTKQNIDSWVLTEGSDSVAEAEGAILESLSRYCLWLELINFSLAPPRPGLV